MNLLSISELLSQNSLANAEYYSKFNVRHNIAMKILQIDYLFNSSLDELNKIPQSQLSKLDHVRFNYWNSSDSCVIVYGNPNSLVMSRTIFFSMNSDSSLLYSEKSDDMSLVRAIARIVEDNRNKIFEAKKSNIDLNTYILNSKDTIEFFLLPTWQTSGYIVNSGEFYAKYFFNRKNSEISLIDSITTDKKSVYFKGGTEEIVLNYSNLELPPVGAFVFSMMYNDYFKRIILESKKKKSYLMNIFDGSYAHFDK